MTSEIFRFTFKPEVPVDEVEGTILLSIVAAESLHGQPQVRLDAAYAIDPEKRCCVIDGSSEVGRDLVRIFTGFAIREFGDRAFSVARAEPKNRSQKACA